MLQFNQFTDCCEWGKGKLAGVPSIDNDTSGISSSAKVSEVTKL